MKSGEKLPFLIEMHNGTNEKKIFPEWKKILACVEVHLPSYEKSSLLRRETGSGCVFTEIESSILDKLRGSIRPMGGWGKNRTTGSIKEPEKKENLFWCNEDHPRYIKWVILNRGSKLVRASKKFGRNMCSNWRQVIMYKKSGVSSWTQTVD